MKPQHDPDEFVERIPGADGKVREYIRVDGHRKIIDRIVRRLQGARSEPAPTGLTPELTSDDANAS